MDSELKVQKMINAAREIRKSKNDPFTVKLGEIAEGKVYSTEETLIRLTNDILYRGEKRRRTDQPDGSVPKDRRKV